MLWKPPAATAPYWRSVAKLNWRSRLSPQPTAWVAQALSGTRIANTRTAETAAILPSRCCERLIGGFAYRTWRRKKRCGYRRLELMRESTAPLPVNGSPTLNQLSRSGDSCGWYNELGCDCHESLKVWLGLFCERRRV